MNQYNNWIGAGFERDGILDIGGRWLRAVRVHYKGDYRDPELTPQYCVRPYVILFSAVRL
ncbi:MAG: hypothetical protein QUS14_05995 [Pyrinomonadaceae bacterium]|nr:hypothetical protein [Pyrinomonadaceae bacterium]